MHALLTFEAALVAPTNLELRSAVEATYMKVFSAILQYQVCHSSANFKAFPAAAGTLESTEGRLVHADPACRQLLQLAYLKKPKRRGKEQGEM